MSQGMYVFRLLFSWATMLYLWLMAAEVTPTPDARTTAAVALFALSLSIHPASRCRKDHKVS